MGAAQGMFAVVVTFNRISLLKLCISRLQKNRMLKRTLIIDNASTDGTAEWINKELLCSDPNVGYFGNKQNLGGAGGFSMGIRRAVDSGAEWVWIMDDDAEPAEDAAEKLLAVADNPANIYGSLAVSGDMTSWPTTLLTPEPVVTHYVSEVLGWQRWSLYHFLDS